MTIEEQHYDFKRKINKIDSQQNRNLTVPEIDQFLNEARELFVKRIAQPRSYRGGEIGIDTSERTMQDLRSLTKTEQSLSITNNSIAVLPSDCWWPLRATAFIKTLSCPAVVKARIVIQQYDDLFRESPLHRSNFNWRLLNGVYNKEGILLDTLDGQILVEDVHLDYVEKLKYVHNAKGHTGGSYTLPGAQSALTGKQDDDQLSAHREIVDIAVLLFKGELGSSNNEIQYPTAKLKLNEIV